MIGDNDLKTKVTGFLSNLLGSSKKAEACGRLICLRSKNQYTFDFVKLWHIDFYSHPQVMYFDPKLTMVAVGLYNGDIEVYRVQVEKNYQNYEDVKIYLKHKGGFQGGNSDVFMVLFIFSFVVLHYQATYISSYRPFLRLHKW